MGYMYRGKFGACDRFTEYCFSKIDIYSALHIGEAYIFFEYCFFKGQFFSGAGIHKVNLAHKFCVIKICILSETCPIKNCFSIKFCVLKIRRGKLIYISREARIEFVIPQIGQAAPESSMLKICIFKKYCIRKTNFTEESGMFEERVRAKYCTLE